MIDIKKNDTDLNGNEVRISVVVPIYNLEKELSATVESIMRQTHENLEIILVDDGSTDESLKVANRIERTDRRISVISGEHRGALQARLTGTKEATGDWIGFVDGDDLIKPEMYRRLLSNACEFDADISHCGYEEVFIDGRVVMHRGTGAMEVREGSEFAGDLLECKNIELLSVSNKLFKKSLFTNEFFCILQDEFISLNEDLLMNYLLTKRADKVVLDDTCLYRYIQRKESSTRGVTYQNLLGSIRARKIILQCTHGNMRRKAIRDFLSVCIRCYNHILQEMISEEISQREDGDNSLSKIREYMKTEMDSLDLLDSDKAVIGKLIVTAPEVYKQVVINAVTQR